MALVTPTTSSKAQGEEIEKFDKSMRIYSDQYLNYKWHAGGADAGLGYNDIINFKRALNPRNGHHCVMCGDKHAIIPSQNKDVCKTCDTGFWVVKATQIVVKFCKGCKNFQRLFDFRDKPEATKCVKCRQRGRQNYVSKKTGGGEIDATADFGQYLPPSSGMSSVKPIGTASATLSTKMGGNKYGSFIKRGDLTSNSSSFLQANISGAGTMFGYGRGQKRGRSRTLGSLDSDEYEEIDDLDLKQAAEMLLATSYMLNSPKAKQKHMNFDGYTDYLQKSASMDDVSDCSPGLTLSGLARAASDPICEANVGRRPRADSLTTLAELTEHMFGSAGEAADRRFRSNSLDIGSLSAITRACSLLDEQCGIESGDVINESKQDEMWRSDLSSGTAKKEEKEQLLHVFTATTAGNGDVAVVSKSKSGSEELGRPPQHRAGRLRSVSDLGCTSYTNERSVVGSITAFEEQKDFRDRKRGHPADAVTPSPSVSALMEKARPAICTSIAMNNPQMRTLASKDSAAIAASAISGKMDIEAEVSVGVGVSDGGRKRVCSRDLSDDALLAAAK